MELVITLVVGALFSMGIYLMMRRSLVKLIIGLAILTNAVNLLIFTTGGLTRGRPAMVPDGATAPTLPYADPLPQAFILTAIVIGFGVLAFAVVLAMRVYRSLGVDDMDRAKEVIDG